MVLKLSFLKGIFQKWSVFNIMIEKINGLTEEEVKQSKKEFGNNELSSREKETFLDMLIEAFKDPWVLVLSASLLIYVIFFIIGMFIPELEENGRIFDIIAITMAICAVTGLGALSEYKNLSRSEALQEEYSKTTSKVRRNGQLISLPSFEIVKGDVILIQAGDKISVDGLIITGEVKVSQAALNGEPRDEIKTSSDSMSEALSTDFKSHNKLFMGSVVTYGEAYMVATVIGDETELGKINQSLQESDDERESTLGLKLKNVAKSIGVMGVIAASISAVLYVFLALTGASETLLITDYLLIGASALMLMATIVIMAVPEGLPMMTRIVQAMNTESLYKKQVLVKNNTAFADTAYVDVLYSDKTGTITKGVLSVVEFIKGNSEITNKIYCDEFIDSITLNNSARISNEGHAIGSNNMDRALLEYALNQGYEEKSKEARDEKIKATSGFDSDKKCSTVTLNTDIVYWKGAVESILNDITHYIMDDINSHHLFSETDKNALLETMKEQSLRSMKLLASVKIQEGKKILLGIICCRDDVRDDALETVKVLNEAGIHVAMITGDNEDTAVAIAKESGILTNDSDIVLTHDQIESMSDDELKEVLPKLKVVSRAKPLDKKRIVQLSQELGSVVGMTGDGVNDSASLKASDVGFAMGDGTAVAQEAGDIIIMDNSLTAIKDSILNSRTMSKSIGKFLMFQLTVNVACLMINIIAPLLGWINPFSIVSILWMNLIMDTMGALAFGSEPVLARYMKKKPVKREAPLLTSEIKSAIATSGSFITLGAIAIWTNFFGILKFAFPLNDGNDIYARTLLFAFFIYSVVFNGISVRSEKINVLENISDNKKFILIMIGIFIVQTLLLTFAAPIFGTTIMPLNGYLLAMGMALLVIPLNILRKLIIKQNINID